MQCASYIASLFTSKFTVLKNYDDYICLGFLSECWYKNYEYGILRAFVLIKCS